MVESLIGAGRHHAERAVTTGAVVERFDPVEHRAGELDAGLPPAGVEKFGLHARPERLDDSIVVRVADRAERVDETRAADALAERPRRVLRTVIAVHQRAVRRLA